MRICYTDGLVERILREYHAGRATIRAEAIVSITTTRWCSPMCLEMRILIPADSKEGRPVAATL